jgi:hypothetical protein
MGILSCENLEGTVPGHERFYGSLLSSPFRNETIADPWLCLYVLLAGFSLELLAELSDEDAEILRLVGGLRTPDRCEQGAVGNHLPGMAREMEEQVKFLGGEVNGPAEDGDGMGVGVDDEVAGFEGG